MKEIDLKDVFRLIISIGIPFLAALIGGIATSASISGWYTTLIKPGFNPPNWIFGPVWTVLYALMGVSLFLVWRKGIHSTQKKLSFAVFGIQLALNVFWSIAFFGLQLPIVALFTIMLLIPAIGFMIYKFYRIEKWAAYLNIPYLLWVLFATVLNFAIVLLN